MEHNTCKTCGASNGRAGLLINDECMNCHDTRKHGALTVHAELVRKPDELNKTFSILDKGKLTPHYARKLQQALLDIGHIVEKDTATPTIEDLQQLFDEFVKRRDKKAVDKLLGGLVRWEVGEL